MREEKFEQMRDWVREITGIDLKYAKGRRQEFVRPRAAFAVVAANWYNITLVDVTQYLGLKNHTSMVHHRKNHVGRYRSDDEYASIYDSLMMKVRQKAAGEDVSVVLEMIKQL